MGAVVTVLAVAVGLVCLGVREAEAIRGRRAMRRRLRVNGHAKLDTNGH